MSQIWKKKIVHCKYLTFSQACFMLSHVHFTTVVNNKSLDSLSLYILMLKDCSPINKSNRLIYIYIKDAMILKCCFTLLALTLDR